MITAPRYPTLADLLPLRQSTTRDAALVLAGSLLVALTAQVSVPLPFTPVPLTGQTLGVLLVGAALGGRLGALALLAYLAEVMLGLPFAAGGTGGLVKFLGPTAGYLLACPLAAWLVGSLVDRRAADRRVLSTIAAMLLGNLVIYALGATWLGAFLARAGNPDAVASALRLGVLPFLPGDAIKLLLAALLLPGAWRWLAASRR